MSLFHVLTGQARTGLHIWRMGTELRVNLRAADEGDGWMRFQYPLDPAQPGEIGMALFTYDDADLPSDWEDRDHQRVLPRAAGGGLPADAWLVPGTARVLTEDPRASAAVSVRVHLVSARRYRDSRLHGWGPGGSAVLSAAGA